MHIDNINNMSVRMPWHENYAVIVTITQLLFINPFNFAQLTHIACVDIRFWLRSDKQQANQILCCWQQCLQPHVTTISYLQHVIRRLCVMNVQNIIRDWHLVNIFDRFLLMLLLLSNFLTWQQHPLDIVMCLFNMCAPMSLALVWVHCVCSIEHSKKKKKCGSMSLTNGRYWVYDVLPFFL